MQTTGRVFGVFLALIAIPIFVMASCNFAVEQTIVNPDTYKQAFEDQSVFEDLLPITLPALLATVDEEELAGIPFNLDDARDALDTDEWRAVTREILPPEWLEGRYNQFIDLIIGILNGNFDVLETPFILDDLRQRLMGAEGRRAAQSIMEASPPCSPEQTNAMRAAIAGNATAMPVCQPLGPALRRQSVNYIADWFNALGQTLPRQNPPIAEFLQIDNNDARILNLFFNIDRQVLIITYLCPMGLLSLLVFATVRSLKGFGWWIGGSLLFSGLAIVGTLVLLQFAFIDGLSNVFEAQNELETFASQIFASLLRSAFLQSSGNLLLMAVFFVVVGFVLFLVGFFAPAPSGKGFNDSVFYMTEDGQIVSTASLQPGSSTLRLDDTSTQG